jgi:hypothetical protein
MAIADNQQVKSRRESFSERLKSKYPDMDFADEEVMFGRINDDYDDYDSQISTYKDREKKMADMFSADPRSAHFLVNWREGGDPVVELVRMFGTDIKERLEDPEWQAQIAEANKDFVERVAKEKALEEEYQKNLVETKDALDRFQEKNGLSDDEVDEVMGMLQKVLTDGVMGKFSEQSMEFALKALNHDNDVEVATQEGEVRGRNAKIDEKLRTRKAGDGTAPLNGGNNDAGNRRPQPSLGALDNFANGDDIWSRGGEKRTKYNS